MTTSTSLEGLRGPGVILLIHTDGGFVILTAVTGGSDTFLGPGRLCKPPKSQPAARLVLRNTLLVARIELRTSILQSLLLDEKVF